MDFDALNPVFTDYKKALVGFGRSGVVVAIVDLGEGTQGAGMSIVRPHTMVNATTPAAIFARETQIWIRAVAQARASLEKHFTDNGCSIADVADIVKMEEERFLAEIRRNRWETNVKHETKRDLGRRSNQ